MPKVTLPRLRPVGGPGPVHSESLDRPTAAPWVWPAVVAVACGPFVLTAVGLAVAVLRTPSRPPAEVVAVPVVAPAAPTEPPAAPVEVIAAEPRAVDGVDDPPGPVPVAVVTFEAPKSPPAKPARCDRFGTAIDFVRSPALAFDRAAREQKLVMVLHLAGYFDDPGFT